jgi:5'-nucleotidase / UDP-sugar diphosphatase
LGGGAGSYPFAAGLRYDIDYNQEFGNRISNVEMNIRLEQDCWSPLNMDDSVSYTVATNSFVAGGRDGYFTFLDVVSFMILRGLCFLCDLLSDCMALHRFLV